MSVTKVNKKLFHTKPAGDLRLDKEMASFEVLEKLDIPYTAIDHEAAATVEDCIEIEAVLGVEICKNLFLRNQSKTEFYLLVMPGAKRFITKYVSKQIGSSRLSFAEAEFMEKYLNITPGSVSILGLMNDMEKNVHLLIDREIVESEYIGCHPCINTSSLKIRMVDIMEKFLPYTGHEPLIVEL
ncbi:MAG: prolyl-tRNA synthetase associated domain-containing protein [Clostridia bacterium]|nr:prolyl-tRNA synthetase associated domain-containing protein [Clostridia bacterium]